MASEFAVKIVTPEKVFYEGQTEMIIVRTTQGDRGILKNHRPLVAGLSDGTLKIKKEGKYKEAKVSGGFIQVEKEQAVVLTESAEWL
ncbi:ATP hydrolase subunit epsilon [[Clostridium] sordellii]|uniref:ATP synthase epsilon chain n=1 Tax=Paraclostridium sordellii TaxID=1505 RepID=A0A0A1S2F7_PARSO|nr:MULTISPECIES: ATP synthase F1 subunit epsilon [Paeniclostridium]MDU5019446.1 ATP synthase F1 subunit epsilon [Clostridiales bacterium]AUN12967.1 ATP synthase F1 subunit epsilon [Paeniclostridium sordellii]EPZ54358.1 ATP synthase F1, epsilon subunit [[Clostridium] sordellii VPI 9048] [Paeniclostridium sordellii VPI 9048]MBS6025080.1 ATP synthase F1 subunit epsilon [Paeniclostridium sordellii]MBW4863942.1 ATP synthase F1 subunit epsilon [Paeniclostridium sp.]